MLSYGDLFERYRSNLGDDSAILKIVDPEACWDEDFENDDFFNSPTVYTENHLYVFVYTDMRIDGWTRYERFYPEEICE